MKRVCYTENPFYSSVMLLRIVSYQFNVIDEYSFHVIVEAFLFYTVYTDVYSFNLYRRVSKEYDNSIRWPTEKECAWKILGIFEVHIRQGPVPEQKALDLSVLGAAPDLTHLGFAVQDTTDSVRT